MSRQAQRENDSHLPDEGTDSVFEKLIRLPQRGKRCFLWALDLFSAFLAIVVSMNLSGMNVGPPLANQEELWVELIFVAFAGLFSFLLGTHRIKLYGFDFNATRLLLLSASFSAAIGVLANWFGFIKLPLSVPIFSGLLFFFLACGFRTGVLGVLKYLMEHREGRGDPVAVYGAGAAGVQLISALRKAKEFLPVALVDDNSSLEGLSISSLTVRKPSELQTLTAKGLITQVLLAMPSVAESRRREILYEMKNLNCKVLVMPSYPELIGRGGFVESLKPVSTMELLGREKVEPVLPEIAKNYSDKVLMVTGAGGSIGSELCRQLLRFGPKKLILFECGEYALYSIHRELRPLAERNDVLLEAVLGSVTDRGRVEVVLMRYGVTVVFHAAAYKHLPIVEENETEGASNNVIGTRVMGEAVAASNAESFVLVSTDKAVRPTNVMGATKRLAELVTQDLQKRYPEKTFSMVRFGNVLGSSGSVVPLFREQIARGGPVTLTHGEVTRYFMTIPEAAQLVLLAGCFAKGGDVFVLDMGDPVRIWDLAERMIHLSGLTVRDSKSPSGDIEIQITGLRSGEKLHEELIMGEDLLATPHEKIMRVREPSLQSDELSTVLDELSVAIELSDGLSVRRILSKVVDGFDGGSSGRRIRAAEFVTSDR